MEVVDSEEAVAEYFFFDHKVAKIALGKSSARVASAVHNERFLAFRKFALGDAHMSAVFFEEISVARQTGGDNTIEHIHAGGNGVHNILRVADAHKVARFLFGEERRGELHGVPYIFF